MSRKSTDREKAFDEDTDPQSIMSDNPGRPKKEGGPGMKQCNLNNRMGDKPVYVSVSNMPILRPWWDPTGKAKNPTRFDDKHAQEDPIYADLLLRQHFIQYGLLYRSELSSEPRLGYRNGLYEKWKEIEEEEEEEGEDWSAYLDRQMQHYGMPRTRFSVMTWGNKNTIMYSVGKDTEKAEYLKKGRAKVYDTALLKGESPALKELDWESDTQPIAPVKRTPEQELALWLNDEMGKPAGYKSVFVPQVVAAEPSDRSNTNSPRKPDWTQLAEICQFRIISPPMDVNGQKLFKDREMRRRFRIKQMVPPVALVAIALMCYWHQQSQEWQCRYFYQSKPYRASLYIVKAPWSSELSKSWMDMTTTQRMLQCQVLWGAKVFGNFDFRNVLQVLYYEPDQEKYPSAIQETKAPTGTTTIRVQIPLIVNPNLLKDWQQTDHAVVLRQQPYSLPRQPESVQNALLLATAISKKTFPIECPGNKPENFWAGRCQIHEETFRSLYPSKQQYLDRDSKGWECYTSSDLAGYLEKVCDTFESKGQLQSLKEILAGVERIKRQHEGTFVEAQVVKS